MIRLGSSDFEKIQKEAGMAYLHVLCIPATLWRLRNPSHTPHIKKTSAELKESKIVSSLSQTQQYIFIYLFILFYLDNMFWSSDHHQTICIKLRIKCMQSTLFWPVDGQLTETCCQDTIIEYILCVWLKLETILFSFSLITWWDVLCKHYSGELGSKNSI